MGEVVVSTDDTPPDDGTTAAYAAGVAAATASQAAGEAQEAVYAAEGAQMTAEGAAETAWDAQREVESLRGQVSAELDELRQQLNATTGLAVATAEVAAEPPVDETSPEDTGDGGPAVEATSEDETTAKAPRKERKFGSDRWFGDR
jgi:uncharacterized protein YjbJ (UPF0337 family)